MYSEESRKRNMKTCCVFLEMAVAVFMKTWCTCSSCVFFFCFCVCVCVCVFLSYKFKGKQGTVRSGLITVLRTVRFDRGSHGSLLLSSRTVLDAKRTTKMSGLRFFRSDSTVRSGFHNHEHHMWHGRVHYCSARLLLANEIASLWDNLMRQTKPNISLFRLVCKGDESRCGEMGGLGRVNWVNGSRVKTGHF